VTAAFGAEGAASTVPVGTFVPKHEAGALTAAGVVGDPPKQALGGVGMFLIVSVVCVSGVFIISVRIRVLILRLAPAAWLVKPLQLHCGVGRSEP